jgi:hypothetical protein
MAKLGGNRFDWQMITGERQDNEGMSILSGSYHAFGNNNTHSINGHISTGSGATLTVLNALGAPPITCQSSLSTKSPQRCNFKQTPWPHE